MRSVDMTNDAFNFDRLCIDDDCVSLFGTFSLYNRRMRFCVVVSSLLFVQTEAFGLSGGPEASTTTRRESFGDLVAATLLPVATADVLTATPAHAEDDYPFKVRRFVIEHSRA